LNLEVLMKIGWGTEIRRRLQEGQIGVAVEFSDKL
jgi:hypothetical protein